ncbi:MAG: histidinol dehydrogenase [Bacteroidaceae bacterium]|nr:histidinol dehydrogenase [Bacteroidaceae bacterium]
MKKYINPDRSEWPSLVKRVSVNDDVIAGRVEAILARVKSDGDKAIRELAREIDGVELGSIEVSSAEFDEAATLVAQDVKDAIAKAAANIAKFHAAQCFKPIEVETAPGVKCVQRSVAIRKVGLYVPGGTAPLFSTVLMLAIPAKVAGCPQIVLCTPTNKEGKVAPAVLYAARVCGVDNVYKVGGAQAVGAMAYGTETIPAVDKIFGPGNRYVTKAKESVTDRVSIDMPAGPSEVMVMADETADARFVASDLLSQAEHGADSQALLVCGSEAIADAVCCEVERQLDKLPRKELTEKALVESRLVVLPTVEQQIEFANMYAAEHLIISMREPWKIAEQITAAGSVFIGNYSPESAGDYASGTNHTLPTSGWARSCSGVNIDSFTRKITYQELTTEGMAQLGPTIVAMAVAEGLDAHANAARLRMGEEI